MGAISFRINNAMILELHFESDKHFGLPTLEIAVDDQILYNGFIKDNFTFDIDLIDGNHQLKITHFGKNKKETTVDYDKHFKLTKILMDNVDLDLQEHCRLSHQGIFRPDYHPDFVKDQTLLGVIPPETIQPNHYFGHNGTWTLDFKTPALLWIIESQNPSGMHLEDTIFRSGQDTINDIKEFFGIDD